MKKTVTIVTIPLDKQGFEKGDIVKRIKKSKVFDEPVGFIAMANLDKTSPNEYWQAEQLLVLSDDEILEGDFCTLLDGFGNVILGNPQKYNPDEGHVLNKGLKKTIAAYPTIDGVLPISKETVQAWIDSGTPKKGSVDMLYWCKNGDSLSGCEKQAHCNCSDNTDPDVDTQGNLLLEFGEPIKSESTCYIPIEDEVAKITVNKKIWDCLISDIKIRFDDKWISIEEFSGKLNHLFLPINN